MSRLGELRAQIEALDAELLAILGRRLAVVEAIAAAKLEAASPLRDRAREDHLLSGLRARAVAMGLPPHGVERLYRVILELSIARQEAAILARSDVPLRVAYQGVEGAYSHLAAQRRYAGRRGGVLLTGHPTFRAAAEAVRRGHADLALLPVENSSAGSVHETYDVLGVGGLVVTGEVVTPIEHCLLGVRGATVTTLRTVRSHPQALAQCEAFLAERPHLVAEVALDTAGAAQAVAAAGDPSVGAIASRAAAAAWGLEILAAGIQTAGDNATRFLEVALRPAALAPDAVAKTSLVLELADRPGALAEVLASLARRGISMTRLESRPLPGRAFRYRFYIDVLGHAESASVASALTEMRAAAVSLDVLGTYAADGGGPAT